MDIKHEGKTYHPNIKKKQISNRKKALRYCSKEDPEPLEFNIDIKAETAARDGHKRILGNKLIKGEITINQLVEDHPEYLFEYQKIASNLEAYKRSKREEKPDMPQNLPNPWGLLMPAYKNSK